MDAEILRKRFIATHIINHWQKAGVLTGGQCSAPPKVCRCRSNYLSQVAPPATCGPTSFTSLIFTSYRLYFDVDIYSQTLLRVTIFTLRLWF